MNKWILQMDGIPAFTLKTTERPKYINNAWQPLAFSLYDPISPNCAQRVFDWLKSKELKDIDLSLLNSENSIVEKWFYKKASIMEVDFGKLSYLCDEPVEIKVIVKYEDVNLWSCE